MKLCATRRRAMDEREKTAEKTKTLFHSAHVWFAEVKRVHVTDVITVRPPDRRDRRAWRPRWPAPVRRRACRGWRRTPPGGERELPWGRQCPVGLCPHGFRPPLR